MIRLGIIGVGVQTRRTHLPCVRYAQRLRRQIEVVAAADFAAQLVNLDPLSRTVLAFVDLVKTNEGLGVPFPAEAADEVVDQPARAGVDGVIVAAEPMAHGVYIRALEEAGIRYLVDRPYLCGRDISIDPDVAASLLDELS